MKFEATGTVSYHHSAYNPSENGEVQVHLLDTTQKEMNPSDLKPGDRDNLFQVLIYPDTFYLKVTNSGGKATVNPIQLQIYGLAPPMP